MSPVRELPERLVETPTRPAVPTAGAAADTRETHPPGDSWRADALAKSPHSRLADEIPQPLADFDAPRASALCAEICRDLLRDFAPGLLLLPAEERRRVQALAAHARTLLDFACQRGVEGERLAQINRWEWELEAALDGQPAGQPVFVALAAAERERPWPRIGLDALTALARRLASREEPAFEEADADALAAALAGSLFGAAPSPAVRELGAIALAAEGLIAPVTPRVAAARLVRLDSLDAATAPADYLRFLHFVRFAARELLGQVARGVGTPQLGLAARLRCLVRGRWGVVGRKP